jgi:hypothetical protein
VLFWSANRPGLFFNNSGTQGRSSYADAVDHAVGLNNISGVRANEYPNTFARLRYFVVEEEELPLFGISREEATCSP